MRTRTAAIVTAGLLLTTLTACGSSDNDKPAAPASKTASQADLDAARKAAGLPPRPDTATTAAYIKALNAIDVDIAHGKRDKAVSRGMDTCGIIKRFPGDEAKQADQTNKRWSSPTHPDGHGLATAKKILAATHKHLCPDF
ncbi:hypothetical protein ACIO3R_01560 [Streptomyces sp. NPDC087428]|uniref:hypothetical protein n=1 Tax=Streptomyces sp. NPDC087428 TaxID=3365788 RepID=UPI00380487FA